VPARSRREGRNAGQTFELREVRAENFDAGADRAHQLAQPLLIRKPPTTVFLDEPLVKASPSVHRGRSMSISAS
jgi:hypothetical protein